MTVNYFHLILMFLFNFISCSATNVTSISACGSYQDFLDYYRYWYPTGKSLIGSYAGQDYSSYAFTSSTLSKNLVCTNMYDASCIYACILMISMLSFLVVFLLKRSSVNQLLMATLNVIFAGYHRLTLVIFGPKMASRLYYKVDLGANGDGNKVNPRHVVPADTIIPAETGAGDPAGHIGTVVQSSEFFKSMTKNQRVGFCKQQIDEWEETLMQTLEIDNSGSQGKVRNSIASDQVAGSLDHQMSGMSDSPHIGTVVELPLQQDVEDLSD